MLAPEEGVRRERTRELPVVRDELQRQFERNELSGKLPEHVPRGAKQLRYGADELWRDVPAASAPRVVRGRVP
jgi:hypothetical protein